MSSVISEDVEVLCSLPLEWASLRGKRFLITGAGGLIGSYVTRALLTLSTKLELGIHVSALVRDRTRAQRALQEGTNNPCLHWIEQDVNNPLPPTIGPIDTIIHAASLASPRHYSTHPVNVILPNVIGTHNLLEFARRSQTSRFVLISAGEVYGKVPPDLEWIPENYFGGFDPLENRWCYGESKRLAEALCKAWQVQYQMDFQILRPFHTYGPGIQLDDGRVFSDFIAQIHAGSQITLKSAGTAVRSYCYLSDFFSGLMTVLIRGEPNQAYNIGNTNQVYSVRALAEHLIGVFPEKNLKLVFANNASAPNAANPMDRYVPDTSKLRALGWNPQVSVEHGFKKTLESLL